MQVQARVGIIPQAVRELVPLICPRNQVVEHVLENLGLHVLMMVLKALRTAEATKNASALVGSKK